MKRVESANQLSMKVASDDEDDAVDQLLEHQHQMMMRSSSAYSLASNPDSSGQVCTAIVPPMTVFYSTSRMSVHVSIFFYFSKRANEKASDHQWFLLHEK